LTIYCHVPNGQPRRPLRSLAVSRLIALDQTSRSALCAATGDGQFVRKESDSIYFGTVNSKYLLTEL